MTKLEMATKILLKLIETDKTGFDAEGIAAYSFEIADAMQAEADKRSDTQRPAVLREAAPEYDPTVEYRHDAKVTYHGKVVSIQDIEGSRFWF